MMLYHAGVARVSHVHGGFAWMRGVYIWTLCIMKGEQVKVHIFIARVMFISFQEEKEKLKKLECLVFHLTINLVVAL
jgi:hypothetical protein